MYDVMYQSKSGPSQPHVFVTAIPDRRTADHIAVQLIDDAFVAASWVEEVDGRRWTMR